MQEKKITFSKVETIRKWLSNVISYQKQSMKEIIRHNYKRILNYWLPHFYLIKKFLKS